MHNNSDYFSDKDYFSRIMLGNPYTKEGKDVLVGLGVNMSVKDFFINHNVYVEPFFDSKNTNDTGHTKSEPRKNYKFKFDDDIYEKIEARTDKINFESALKSKKEFPLLFIRGLTGSGKSTYLYACISEYENNDNVIHIPYSLDEHENKEGFWGVILPFNNNNAAIRFLNLAFGELTTIIENILENEDTLSIKRICDRYDSSFRNRTEETDEMIAFFNLLRLHHDKPYNRDNMNIVMKKLAELLDEDIVKSIKNLLICTVKLLFCCYPEKHFLLSFDGIEYLINRDMHIFDSDITKVLRALIDAKNALEISFKDNGNLVAHCKIVICLRDTTMRFFEDDRRVQEIVREKNSMIDISEWYKTREIYAKRLEYYKCHYKNIYSHLVSMEDVAGVIMEDTIFMTKLDKMYNYDKRSLTSNLFEAIKDMLIASPAIGARFIKYYKDWGKLVYIPYSGNPDGHRYRYLCRSAIIRVLLSRIARSNNGSFFDDIYFANIGDECVQSSYARKVLIYLTHHTFEDNRIIDNYVDVRQVINAIARPHGATIIPTGTVQEISKMLYKMGEYRVCDSPWQRLLSLKFNNDIIIRSNDKEQAFIDTIVKLCNDDDYYNNNHKNFGVRITYAGAFFADVQSEYAFFASRAKKEIANTPLIISNDVEYICNKIHDVYNQAIKCIKFLLTDEKRMFGSYGKMYHREDDERYHAKYLYLDGNQLIPHPKRILDNHITYLEHYESFVSNVDDAFDAQTRKSILDFVRIHIDAYKRRQAELKNGYGQKEELVGKRVMMDFSGFMDLCDNDNKPYLSYF
ncbi:MAG: hypothetical protein LBD23_17385 [Oscillospiraceae bacterium]|jgi:hypothetical protein|nr:hypothetical protein [Oscillospiraceae bacterium]